MSIRRHAGIVGVGVALAALALALSCGGGAAVKPNGTSQGSLAGTVVKGPVANATVTAYRTDDSLARGEALGTATTAVDGTFTLTLPPYGGGILVVATDGTYTEESIGLGVKLSSELVTYVPGYASGSSVSGLRITPVSTWAVAKASYHVQKGTSASEAWPAAFTHIAAHFGGSPWESVTPADVTQSATLGSQGIAGLMLAALSQEATGMALASHLSPGLTVNAATLTAALADDLRADGTWDGLGPSGVLSQGTQALDGRTMRLALSQALIDFVRTSHNGTGLKEADVHVLATNLSGATDPYLFCANQDPAKCVGSATDVDPPSIQFSSPAAGAVARGSINVLVVATDASKVKSFAFLAPAALVPMQATLSADLHTATLSTTFDVSALPDGDVTLQMQAVDEWNNSGTNSVTVHVSNHGPTVTITAPSQNAIVNGTVTVTASAQPQAPGTTVTALEVVQGPPGVGSDAIPTADAFSAQWDTTKALEGPLTLRLRATDSAGGIGEASVSVVVDNVPLGVVNAAVWAGVPVQGATVRLVAIDPATGQPVTGRDGGPVLGTSSSVTDADGGVSFTLSQENYSGPVQLQASGTSLSVVDPSDGVTAVALPGSMVLTSFVGSYATGAVLTAHASLWTTIADSAARAVALGKNPDAGTPVGLSAALAITDPMMALHVSRPTSWILRSVRPVSLTGTPQTLRDAVYANMPDVALHQLARDLSTSGHLTPGNVITAFTLTQQLAQDVEDGLFDGLAGGTQLAVSGTPPYSLDPNTSRFRLASSLDAFIRGPRNMTGLARTDVQTPGIFDAIAGDTSPLYPASAAPTPFDSTAPTTTITATFSNGGASGQSPVGSSNMVAGVVSFSVTSTDLSDMRSLSCSVSSGSLVLAAGNSPTTFGASLDTTALADGSYTFTAHACDKVGNCGDTTLAVVVDNTPPASTFTAPDAGFYNIAITVDATATDAHGLASFAVTSLTGFVDTNTAVERIQGPWVFPVGLPEGPLSVVVKACDVVANCASKTSLAAIVDKTPPAVTFSVQYTLGTTTGAPVGAAHLVGGAVVGTANATDQAGVASLVLTTPSATLLPSPGNTASHFAATLDSTTLPDGASSFVARACDRAGNCGDTTYALTVDNTPPTITVLAPSAGYYSASLNVSATASDTNGVAALTTPSLSGFGDTMPAPDVLLGTWVFPSAAVLPDGPITVVFNSVDVVGNPRTASVSNVNADRTPPSLSWVSQPPAWSNSTTTITASATATDTGAGVNKVMFNLIGGSSGPIAGTLSGGVWSATLGVPSSLPPSTTVEVWGIDNASPANSGASTTGAPSKLSAVTTFDRAGPVVTAGAGVAQPSYLPETAWSLKTDVKGHPLVPVQYNQFGALTAVSPGSTVYKLATTLHAVDGNTPVITYQVVTTNKAPIASAVLSNVVALGTFGCTKLAGCPRSHPLTLSTRTATGYAYYDLPLTAEMLDARTGALSLTVTFTDAAGNSITRNDTATLTVLAPPVGFYEDTSWQTASDPQSIYAYRLATNTYDKVYDSANSALHPAAQPAAARVLRYVVENPAPYPVSVDMSPGLASQFRLTETWLNNKYDLQAISPGGTTPVDLITLLNFVRLDPNAVCTDGTPHYNCRFNSSGQPYDPAPPPPPKCQGECWRDFASSGTASSTMQCQVNYYNWTAASTAYNTVNASTNVLAFSDFKTSGNETTAAQQYYSPSLAAMTGAIVPAASATAPGRAVFYYMAPLPASTRAALGFDPLTWQSLAETPTLQYQRTVGWFYKWAPNEGAFCSGASAQNEGYHLNKMNRQLTTATWLFTVTPSVKTGGFTALDATTPVVEGWPTGVPSSALPPISGRTWSH